MRRLLNGLLAATALLPAQGWAKEAEGGARSPGISRRAELREMRERVRAEDAGAAPQAMRADQRPRPQNTERFGGNRGDDRYFRAARDAGAVRPERPAAAPQRPVIADTARSRPDRGDDRYFRSAREAGLATRRDDDWRGRSDARREVRRDDRRDRADRGRSDWDGRNWDGRNWNGRGWDGRFEQPRVNGSGWNRGWRDDRRYDWAGWRNRNTASYRLPRYYAPSGWTGGYRRFGLGVRVPDLLFAQNYWIGDPGYYRLPPAFGPYRWIRYYNDALLVDVRYGAVVDVVYDIFW